VNSPAFPILQSGASLPVIRAYDQLAASLKRAVRGEVRFDPASRALYATDASNYRQVPIGLVIPRDADDVVQAMAVCREHDAPVLARGAGTSLAGQTCNAAVVFDYSKYMRRVGSVDPVARTAQVDPGVVLDRVREAAEQHELTFAPDPATHSRCTLGGMIGNNSCGVHALMGGKTVDNIEALDVLLYDGTRMTVGATSDDELQAMIREGGRRGAIYAGLKRLRDTYANEIRARFPRIPRRVSGYNLDELLPENGFHVARALVGSEGTCVTVLGATLKLVRSPQHRQLVVLGFKDQFIAADAVPRVLGAGPIGLEGFDGLLVDMMHRKGLALDDIALLPQGRGFLLVEFGGWIASEALDKAEAFVSDAKGWPAVLNARRFAGREAMRVWHVREQALGATAFVPGEPHSWEGWEDAAVPPAALGSYLRQLEILMGSYGYRSPMYGHFGQGCVHMRINFDLNSAAGLAKYRAFIDEAADIVLAHGGSLSGEHGDGQSRAALLPKMFGPRIMEAFREFKALWDPHNRMNPGKLVDPVAVYSPIENIRTGDGYQSARPETWFQFPSDGGSFGEATLRCVGVGACRKEHAGTMCPSYMATGEEKHSTRGRAHLLWELMQGDVLGQGWANEEVKEALDLCLSCKACKTECPVNVDVATYKAEFLAHYYKEHPHALRDYAFGRMDQWARLAALVPGLTPRLANAALRIPGARALAGKALGLAPERTLPAFAARPYTGALGRPRIASEAANRAGAGTVPRVVLWPDTWNNYFHPQALRAAERVLRDAGLEPWTPRAHVCCGRPLYDFGMLREARSYLERILERFAPEIDAGLPFVFLEPSCASVFRDELLNFFPENKRAQQLAAQTRLFADALREFAPEYRAKRVTESGALLHGHCHHKALGKLDAERLFLEQACATVAVPDTGCCGMAGPFGFEREKYTVSQTLGERVLLPAVRATEPGTIVVSGGFSCREQIAQGTSRHALHLAEVLAMGLGDERTR
jgi:FAD/FMN-containing dehydrogenase/Fe-S oxidoreductase